MEAPAWALADVDTPEVFRGLGRRVRVSTPSLDEGLEGDGAGRGRPVAPVICFVGPSGSGKTTLIVRLVERFRGRGLRVATVKHASHGFEMDRPGKDSYRHFHAGAEAVLVTSPGGYALVGRQPATEPSLEELLALLPPVDLVLVEGFRGAPFPTVEVRLKHADPSPPLDPAHRLAVAGDEPVEGEGPWFHRDDVEGMAGFILRAAGVAPAGGTEPQPSRP